jgi:HD-GYP domain-containing protein (c-di-GMP phosphodiesterase class II)
MLVRAVTIRLATLAAVFVALYSVISATLPLLWLAGGFGVIAGFAAVIRMPDPEPSVPAPVTAPSPVLEPVPATAPDSVTPAADAVEPVATDECAPGTAPRIRTPYTADAPVVLESLLDAVSRCYDVIGVHLWLRDEGTKTLRLIAAVGSHTPSSAPLPFDEPVLGEAAVGGSAVFQAVQRVHGAGAEGAVWRYALPVGSGETRGVAGVDVKAGVDAPTSDALNRITSALRGPLTAAVALHVAASEIETATILLQAASELSEGEEPAEVLRLALVRAMQVSHAATGSVMLSDEETGVLRIVAADGLSADVVENAAVHSGEGIAGWVYASGDPLLVEDLPGRPANRRHGVLSSVSVPIGQGDAKVGVINAGSRAFPARFTDSYVRALGILGAQTAAALRVATERRRSADLYLANLRALAGALEAHTSHGAGVSARCADLAVAIGRALELSDDELRALETAAVMHDLGMWISAGSVGASDRPLSTVDRGLVMAHPGVGADVMERVPSLRDLAPVVHHHHEHFDGGGYDVGLAGEDIPLGSRIIAVADAYIAMTGERPYREAKSPESAVQELQTLSGTQFDPAVVEAFMHVVAEDPGQADE